MGINLVLVGVTKPEDIRNIPPRAVTSFDPATATHDQLKSKRREAKYKIYQLLLAQQKLSRARRQGKDVGLQETPELNMLLLGAPIDKNEGLVSEGEIVEAMKAYVDEYLSTFTAAQKDKKIVKDYNELQQILDQIITTKHLPVFSIYNQWFTGLYNRENTDYRYKRINGLKEFDTPQSILMYQQMIEELPDNVPGANPGDADVPNPVKEIPANVKAMNSSVDRRAALKIQAEQAFEQIVGRSLLTTKQHFIDEAVRQLKAEDAAFDPINNSDDGEKVFQRADEIAAEIPAQDQSKLKAITIALEARITKKPIVYVRAVEKQYSVSGGRNNPPKVIHRLEMKPIPSVSFKELYARIKPATDPGTDLIGPPIEGNYAQELAEIGIQAKMGVRPNARFEIAYMILPGFPIEVDNLGKILKTNDTGAPIRIPDGDTSMINYYKYNISQVIARACASEVPDSPDPEKLNANEVESFISLEARKQPDRVMNEAIAFARQNDKNLDVYRDTVTTEKSDRYDLTLSAMDSRLRRIDETLANIQANRGNFVLKKDPNNPRSNDLPRIEAENVVDNLVDDLNRQRKDIIVLQQRIKLLKVKRTVDAFKVKAENMYDNSINFNANADNHQFNPKSEASESLLSGLYTALSELNQIEKIMLVGDPGHQLLGGLRIDVTNAIKRHADIVDERQMSRVHKRFLQVAGANVYLYNDPKDQNSGLDGGQINTAQEQLALMRDIIGEMRKLNVSERSENNKANTLQAMTLQFDSFKKDILKYYNDVANNPGLSIKIRMETVAPYADVLSTALDDSVNVDTSVGDKAEELRGLVVQAKDALLNAAGSNEVLRQALIQSQLLKDEPWKSYNIDRESTPPYARKRTYPNLVAALHHLTEAELKAVIADPNSHEAVTALGDKAGKPLFGQPSYTSIAQYDQAVTDAGNALAEAERQRAKTVANLKLGGKIAAGIVLGGPALAVGIVVAVVGSPYFIYKFFQKRDEKAEAEVQEAIVTRGLDLQGVSHKMTSDAMDELISNAHDLTIPSDDKPVNKIILEQEKKIAKFEEDCLMFFIEAQDSYNSLTLNNPNLHRKKLSFSSTTQDEILAELQTSDKYINDPFAKDVIDLMLKKRALENKITEAKTKLATYKDEVKTREDDLLKVISSNFKDIVEKLSSEKDEKSHVFSEGITVPRLVDGLKYELNPDEHREFMTTITTALSKKEGTSLKNVMVAMYGDNYDGDLLINKPILTTFVRALTISTLAQCLANEHEKLQTNDPYIQTLTYGDYISLLKDFDDATLKTMAIQVLKNSSDIHKESDLRNSGLVLFISAATVAGILSAAGADVDPKWQGNAVTVLKDNFPHDPIISDMNMSKKHDHKVDYKAMRDAIAAIPPVAKTDEQKQNRQEEVGKPRDPSMSQNQLRSTMEELLKPKTNFEKKAVREYADALNKSTNPDDAQIIVDIIAANKAKVDKKAEAFTALAKSLDKSNDTHPRQLVQRLVYQRHYAIAEDKDALSAPLYATKHTKAFIANMQKTAKIFGIDPNSLDYEALIYKSKTSTRNMEGANTNPLQSQALIYLLVADPALLKRTLTIMLIKILGLEGEKRGQDLSAQRKVVDAFVDEIVSMDNLLSKTILAHAIVRASQASDQLKANTSLVGESFDHRIYATSVLMSALDLIVAVGDNLPQNHNIIPLLKTRINQLMPDSVLRLDQNDLVVNKPDQVMLKDELNTIFSTAADDDEGIYEGLQDQPAVLINKTDITPEMVMAIHETYQSQLTRTSGIKTVMKFRNEADYEDNIAKLEQLRPILGHNFGAVLDKRIGKLEKDKKKLFGDNASQLSPQSSAASFAASSASGSSRTSTPPVPEIDLVAQAKEHLIKILWPGMFDRADRAMVDAIVNNPTDKDLFQKIEIAYGARETRILSKTEDNYDTDIAALLNIRLPDPTMVATDTAFNKRLDERILKLRKDKDGLNAPSSSFFSFTNRLPVGRSGITPPPTYGSPAAPAKSSSPEPYDDGQGLGDNNNNNNNNNSGGSRPQQ